jgi:hypothetical protein
MVWNPIVLTDPSGNLIVMDDYSAEPSDSDIELFDTFCQLGLHESSVVSDLPPLPQIPVVPRAQLKRVMFESSVVRTFDSTSDDPIHAEMYLDSVDEQVLGQD